MSVIPSRVPVTVLTGFLGSGKTTLLNRILSEKHGKRIAVIENEFGEVGVDSELVIGAEEELFETNNGCICCTVRGDLIRILGQLMKRRDRFDYILIETTGMADPGPVAQTFFLDDELKNTFQLDAIVTMVDAKHFEMHVDELNEPAEQVAFADLVLLNKVDLVDAASLERIERRIRGINGTAKILRTTNADAPIDKVLDVGAFDLQRALAVDEQFLEPEYPFEWGGVYQLTEGDYLLKAGGEHDEHAHAHAHGEDCGHDHDHDHDDAGGELVATDHNGEGRDAFALGPGGTMTTMGGTEPPPHNGEGRDAFALSPGGAMTTMGATEPPPHNGEGRDAFALTPAGTEDIDHDHDHGDHVHEDLELVLLPLPAATPAALQAAIESAVRAFAEPATVVNCHGVIAQPGHYAIDISHGGADFTLPVASAGAYALFFEHHPLEFGLHLVGQRPAAERRFASHHHDDDISSVGISDPRALDATKLNQWLDYLLKTRGADIFRMKGVLNVKGEDRRQVFHGVHMMFDAQAERPWGAAPRVNQLVFIGRGLDRAELEAGFESAVARN